MHTHIPLKTGFETVSFCTGSQVASNVVLFVPDLEKKIIKLILMLFYNTLFVQQLKLALEVLKLEMPVKV